MAIRRLVGQRTVWRRGALAEVCFFLSQQTDDTDARAVLLELEAFFEGSVRHVWSAEELTGLLRSLAGVRSDGGDQGRALALAALATAAGLSGLIEVGPTVLGVCDDRETALVVRR